MFCPRQGRRFILPAKGQTSNENRLEVVANVGVHLRVGAIVRTEAVGRIETKGQVAVDGFNADHVVVKAAREDGDVAGGAEVFNILVAQLRNNREVVGRHDLPAGGLERARELDADGRFKDVHVLFVVEGHGIRVDADVAQTKVRRDGERAVLVGREVTANTERDRGSVGRITETREVVAKGSSSKPPSLSDGGSSFV